MPLSLVSKTGNPVADAAACRAQLRWTSTDEDAQFTGLFVPAAEGRAESATRRQLTSATWDWLLDGFPCGDVLELPLPPLQGVTSIKYLDGSGVEQTWSSSEYVVQAPAGPHCARGRVSPKWGYSWPSVGRTQLGCVVVRFVAGYGNDASSVPAALRSAVLMDIGGLWENRERVSDIALSEVPMSSTAVYRSFRSMPRYPTPPGWSE